MQAEPPSLRPATRRRLSRAELRANVARRLALEATEAHIAGPGEVRLELRAAQGMSWLWLGDPDAPRQALHLRAAQTLCGARCQLSLPAGRVRLGLRQATGEIAVSDAFTVRRPGRVRGRYVSRGRQILRALGWLLLSDALGVGAGLALAYGVKGYAGVYGGMFVGLGIIVTVHIYGFIRIAKSRPEARLEFTPAASR